MCDTPARLDAAENALASRVPRSPVIRFTARRSPAGARSRDRLVAKAIASFAMPRTWMRSSPAAAEAEVGRVAWKSRVARGITRASLATDLLQPRSVVQNEGLVAVARSHASSNAKRGLVRLRRSSGGFLVIVERDEVAGTKHVEQRQ
jgi:hypothetical protein